MSDIGGVRGSSAPQAPKDPSLEDLMKEMADIEKNCPDPAAAAKAIIDKMNSYHLKGDDGKTLKFDTIAQWKDAWQANRGWQDSSGRTMSIPELSVIRDAFEKSANDMVNAQGRLMMLRDALVPSAELKALLDSGDIEGALMMVQTTRARNLDTQLGVRMAQMDARNKDVAKLNASIAAWTKDNPDSHKGDIAEAQGKLGELNNSSQYDMMQMQQIVNKRNEAFDLLTNLMGKFQKTLDGIVSNLR